MQKRFNIQRVFVSISNSDLIKSYGNLSYYKSNLRKRSHNRLLINTCLIWILSCLICLKCPTVFYLKFFLVYLSGFLCLIVNFYFNMINPIYKVKKQKIKVKILSFVNFTHRKDEKVCNIGFCQKSLFKLVAPSLYLIRVLRQIYSFIKSELYFKILVLYLRTLISLVQPLNLSIFVFVLMISLRFIFFKTLACEDMPINDNIVVTDYAIMKPLKWLGNFIMPKSITESVIVNPISSVIQDPIPILNTYPLLQTTPILNPEPIPVLQTPSVVSFGPQFLQNFPLVFDPTNFKDPALFKESFYYLYDFNDNKPDTLLLFVLQNIPTEHLSQFKIDLSNRSSSIYTFIDSLTGDYSDHMTDHWISFKSSIYAVNQARLSMPYPYYYHMPTIPMYYNISYMDHLTLHYTFHYIQALEERNDSL